MCCCETMNIGQAGSQAQIPASQTSSSMPLFDENLQNAMIEMASQNMSSQPMFPPIEGGTTSSEITRNNDGSLSVFGGVINIEGSAEDAQKVAQTLVSDYQVNSDVRSLIDSAIARNETVNVRVGDFGPNVNSSSTITYVNGGNTEDVILNTAQTEGGATSLEHLTRHEVLGHALANLRDANRLGEVGDNQIFLASLYGIEPQGYGTFYG